MKMNKDCLSSIRWWFFHTHVSHTRLFFIFEKGTILIVSLYLFSANTLKRLHERLNYFPPIFLHPSLSYPVIVRYLSFLLIHICLFFSFFPINQSIVLDCHISSALIIWLFCLYCISLWPKYKNTFEMYPSIGRLPRFFFFFFPFLSKLPLLTSIYW